MFLLVLFFLNMDIVLSHNWDSLRHTHARNAVFSLGPHEQAIMYGVGCLFFLLPSLYTAIKNCLLHMAQEKLSFKEGFDYYKDQLIRYFLNALYVGGVTFLLIFFYDKALFTQSTHEWAQLLVKFFQFFSFLLVTYIICVLSATFIMHKLWLRIQKKVPDSENPELLSHSKEKIAQNSEASPTIELPQGIGKILRMAFMEILAIFVTILIITHILIQFVQKYY